MLFSRGFALSTSRRFFSTVNPASCLSREAVQARVGTVLTSYSIQPTSIRNGDHFVATLGFDRVTVKKIVQSLSSEFCVDVPYSEANKIVSIDSAIDYFATHPKAR